MMRTTALLVVFTLFVIFYEASAVPVASSYNLENENVMDVMEAKEKSEEAGDDEKEDEESEKEDKHDDEEDEEKKDDSPKDDEDSKDDEEKKDEKEEDEQEPDINEEQNDSESSGEESVDLDSDHLVLQGSGSGKIKGVVIDDSEKEKDKPEKRSVDSQKKSTKATQVQGKRCGCWGEAGEGCGCGNCCGGFECPHTCGGCGCGCCPQLNFPVTFGACVNNPCCECCQKKPPKGKCQWPCMWPCCCECDPPKFKFTPLKPKPMCHCPNGHGSCCGKKSQGPTKRSAVEKKCGCGGYGGCGGCGGCGWGYGYGDWDHGYGYGLGPWGGYGGYGPWGYGSFGGYFHGGPFPFY
ncbi:unnamed protein product [Porites lobata]|uniref:Uncharacterized protein n=1 Tax=Porites lobata TaxID=104759 RepID=A0ABN8MSP8_9CNID|nr:unnamed protein product [Porites lobata]